MVQKRGAGLTLIAVLLLSSCVPVKILRERRHRIDSCIVQLTPEEQAEYRRQKNTAKGIVVGAIVVTIILNKDL